MTNAETNEKSLEVVLFYRYKLCMKSRIPIRIFAAREDMYTRKTLGSWQA